MDKKKHKKNIMQELKTIVISVFTLGVVIIVLSGCQTLCGIRSMHDCMFPSEKSITSDSCEGKQITACGDREDEGHILTSNYESKATALTMKNIYSEIAYNDKTLIYADRVKRIVIPFSINQGGVYSHRETDDKGKEREEPILSINNQEAVQDIDNPNTILTEGQITSTSPSETDSIKNKEEDNSQQKTDWIQMVLMLIQAISSIGTIATVIVAKKTLDEMQTERDNVYRPVFMVLPDSFEGELMQLKQIEDPELYISILLTASDPDYAYIEHPSDGFDYLFLEKPYVTLKNISKGIAKDVTVSFSLEWMRRAIDRLNENARDDERYTMVRGEGTKSNYSVGLRMKDDYFYDFTRFFEEDLIKKITYVSSDNNTIQLPLPECWNIMFTRICNQKACELIDKGYIYVFDPLIPDLLITIRYSDLQGKIYEQKEIIPWSCLVIAINDTSSDEDKLKTVHMSVRFYENYLW